MIERLQTYVWEDHQARWRNDLSSVVISVCSYMICLRLGVGENNAVNFSMVLLVVTVTATTIWYCVKHQTRKTRSSQRKVRLIWQLLVIVLAVFSKVTTTSLEAGVVGTELRWAAHGVPTRDKLEKAVRIVNAAKRNDVRVSPSVISRIGQKMLGTAAQPHLQKAALEAANQFASYQSSLQARPLTVTHITTLTGTPTDPKGPPIAVDVGCAKAINGAEARTGNIFGFAGFTVSNCADLVISPAKPEVLHLDNVDSRNVTFVNCALIYNGGKLKLENVRFVNCTFQVSDAYANNENVLKLLSAALSGQPINLELTAKDDHSSGK